METLSCLSSAQFPTRTPLRYRCSMRHPGCSHLLSLLKENCLTDSGLIFAIMLSQFKTAVMFLYDDDRDTRNVCVTIETSCSAYNKLGARCRTAK